MRERRGVYGAPPSVGGSGGNGCRDRNDDTKDDASEHDANPKRQPMTASEMILAAAGIK
jgi:hypothetical protein